MNYLKHHGILGQKWGVRRYQNPDGSLTSAGESRYYGPNASKNAPRFAKEKGESGAKSSASNSNNLARYNNQKEVKGNAFRSAQTEGYRAMKKDGVIKKVDAARSKYNEEYAQSERGQTLRSKIADLSERSYQAYRNDSPDSDKLWDEWFDTGTQYNRERAEYRATRLVEEFGAEIMSLESSFGREMISNGKTVVEKLSKEWMDEEIPE